MTTINKVRRWQQALRSAASAKAALNQAEVELANAQNDLGKWLVPEDHGGEEFNVWVGDGILAARRNTAPGASMYDFLVKWRKPVSAKVACEMSLS